MTIVNRLVGLTGRKRSGKNTAGEVFNAIGFTEMSFAAPIKIMIAALLAYQGLEPGLIRRMIDGDLKEVPTPYLGGRSPRYAMQKLGTEWGRDEMADSLWVDILMNAQAQYPAVVVTDVRFPNEVDCIKAAGGNVFRIKRPALASNDDTHQSEALIDDLVVDQEFLNSADSALEFQAQINSLLLDAVPSAQAS